MWDSTIVGDTTLQTSPLKMVRLLRPSTILEENFEDQSNSSLGGDDVSSHISFQSAQKGSETSAKTSCYETGHDTTGASAHRKVSHYTQSESSEESHELEKSIILINLDNTLEPPANEHATVTELITNDNKNMHGCEKLSSSASFDDSYGVIELTEKSLHVNDTMEEVEYMMKKCMHYMQAAEPTTKLGNLSPTVNETQMVVKPLQEREKTFTYSPKKAKSNCGSPAKKFINGKPTAVVTGTKVQFTY
ncbi:uncharacterized protein [Eurosta solidaginis]|uniref:uncharacterized protein n=1 Tax=Eurosta solidaginis TaxID=178769 RepID=UPI0035311116